MYKSIMHFLVLANIIFAVVSCKVPSGLDRVWAIDDGEKIRQDDITNPLASDENNSSLERQPDQYFRGKK